MLALLKQLAKLLILVFNLPAVFKLLTQLFKMEQRDGKIELGVVNVIAETLSQQDVQQMTQEVEQGKQKRRAEVERETSELINEYRSLDEESREYFIQQAQARRQRILQNIENTNPQDIFTDEFIEQLIETKKKQLEPAIVPALTPITAFLGIPAMLLKLQEYIPGFSPPGLTSKSEADGRGSDYISNIEDTDDVGEPVGVGDLQVTKTSGPRRLTSTPTISTTMVWTAAFADPPLTFSFTSYGNLNGDSPYISDLFSINRISPTQFSITIEKATEFNGITQVVAKQIGYGEETQIVIRVTDNTGKFADITIPTLVTQPGL